MGYTLFKSRLPLLQHTPHLSCHHWHFLHLHNHPVTLKRHHQIRSCHYSPALGCSYTGHSLGLQYPDGMGLIHDSLALVGRELDWEQSRDWGSEWAPHKALGWNRELDVALVLDVDRAVDEGMALDSHNELGEDAALGVVLALALVEELNMVLDTERVLKIAEEEDMGGVLDLGMALGEDIDVVQELGTAAMMALETGHDAVAHKALGMGVVLSVASDLGRRHPKGLAGHSSGIFL